MLTAAPRRSLGCQDALECPRSLGNDTDLRRAASPLKHVHGRRAQGKAWAPEGSRQPLWTLRRQRRAALVLPCSSTQEAAGSVHKGGCGRGREGQGGPARLRARARVRHLVLPRRAGHVDGPPADPGAAQRLERALRLAGMPAPQQPPHGRPPGVTPNRNASVQTTALTLRHSRPAPAPCITAAPSNTGGRYA